MLNEPKVIVGLTVIENVSMRVPRSRSLTVTEPNPNVPAAVGVPVNEIVLPDTVAGARSADRSR